MSETRQISKLGMPKWGLTMTEGTVIEWLTEEGAELAVGDEVVEVESEKINNVVEAPAAGILRRRVAAEGDVVPVGGLMGVIADASVPDAEIDAFVEEFQATFVPEEEAAAGPAPETLEVDGRRIQYLEMGEGGIPLVFMTVVGIRWQWASSQKGILQRNWAVAGSGSVRPQRPDRVNLLEQ